MLQPIDFLRFVIDRWEGGYQSYADDAGNWVTKSDGSRLKIGTMRGVTPMALAQHLGVPAYTLTPERMQQVTLDEAANIGLVHYYYGPRFHLLAWGPATASLLDYGWGAGPGQAVLTMQRLIGVAADGAIGQITSAAYNAWLDKLGQEKATAVIHDARAAFYQHICEVNPDNNRFLQGWLNRADWASAVDPEWQKAWA